MDQTGVLTHRMDGAGKPVLLLNGGMMSIASWDAIAGPLAARYRVLRCDFRGQLRSPGAPPADLLGHVADVVALLDALDVGRTNVIATSFGAEVGLLLAATHPGRITSLVAATATDVATSALRDGGRLGRACSIAAAGGDRTRLLEMLEPIFYSEAYIAAHRKELAERAAQIAQLPGQWFSGAADLLASLENLDLRPYLGSITCPVLVVAAGEDRVMPLERSRALASAVHGARVEVVEGSGHALVVEKPEEFTQICLRFLERNGAQGGLK